MRLISLKQHRNDANARYARSLIEASLDPLVTISADGKITDVNRATEEVTGVARERLIGSDFSDYFTEPEKARAGYQQAFSRGLVRDYPLEIRHSSGRTASVLYNASVYRDEAGGVQGVFAAARDVTERQKMRLALQNERERLYAVLEALPAYVVLLDQSYHVPFANKYFIERFGESHGKRCYEYLFNRSQPCDNCESYKVMQTRAPHHWEWFGPDNRNYDIFDYPFNDSDGSFMILEMGIDITERKRMEENMKKVLKEVQEAVNVLTPSASQILAATRQASSGVAEAAAAVSETTATVEEVRQAAQLTSQKANEVSENAQMAVKTAQSGKKAVEQLIEGMHQIRLRVESIAESTVRLSEHGQSISEIINTVHDIADQSNLLAINAAIEAAKAGEQGKGFAVVAQEIKNLSEQSKQATERVRAILGDIQKGTTTTVMATEQGSKAAETGTQHSAAAEETIHVLADYISEAAQAAAQISVSSQQQMAGMDQIASAMEDIKQTSIQNATSAKQVDIAAQDLHELAQKLKKLLD